MRQKSEPAAERYLAMVSEQLRGLDELERTEVVRELADHLEDTGARWREWGLPLTEVQARAVAVMGDPVEVGQRIRRERLAQRLPLGEAILAAAPALIAVIPPLMFAALSLISFPPDLPEGAHLPFLLLGTVLAPLVCLLGFWRRRLTLWVPTLFGYCAVLFALVVSLIGDPGGYFAHHLETTYAGVILSLPLAGLLARRGSLVATLAVLGGLAFAVQGGWLIEEGYWQWYRFAALLVPVGGIAAFSLVSRRLQPVAAWLAFLADWAMVPLLSVYAWTWYSGLGALTGPLTAQRVWNEFPVIAFLSSALALLAAQVGYRVAPRHWLERARDGLRVS